MKKLFTLLLSVYYCITAGYSLAGINPYSFYPSRIYRPKGEFFRSSKNLIDMNPLRPLVITDKNGNKMYVTSSGEVMVSVDRSGNKTFTLKGRRSHTKDSKGRLTRQWERTPGSNMVVVKNEFGEEIQTEEYRLGGKVVAEYDADGNLTKSYEYNKYGKRMEWVVDELTQSRIRYGNDGKPLYDIDSEGNKIATYEYDIKGRLDYRQDVYGNRTYFDKIGNRLKTVAKEGYEIATYKYKKDKNGYYEVGAVKDEVTGNITLYRDGKQHEVRNFNGVVVRSYKWQGTMLVYTQAGTGEITWYKTNRPTYTTYKGEMVQEWMYYDGKLMGMWDENKKRFELYSHGRKEIEIGFNDRPEIEELLKKYELYGLEI